MTVKPDLLPDSLLVPLSGSPIIFTDLDGTLLDHDTYQFDAAAKALVFIREHAIPLIINSSKTFAEIEPLQQKLGICQPFICENGAAVYFPTTLNGQTDWHCHAFAEPRKRVLEILSDLRGKGFAFRGFSDCSSEEIMTMTGLTETEAGLAEQRGFSEPLQWLDSEVEKQKFLAELKAQGLQAIQGGRFLTVCGDQDFDKGLAMEWFCTQHKADQQSSLLKIALGDSPNDFPMLRTADVAVLIKAKTNIELDIEHEGLLIKTCNQGPAGWQEAIDSLIPRIQLI